MDQRLTGRELMDRDGEAVGKVTDVISDPSTLQPEWVTVKTGRFGGEHLVPVKALEVDGGRLMVSCTKDDIKNSPSAKDHTAPTSEEREALYQHYTLPVP